MRGKKQLHKIFFIIKKYITFNLVKHKKANMPRNLLLIAGLIIWVYALFEVLQSRFEDNATKLIWVLVVILLNVLGAILYLLIGRKQRI